MLATTLRSIGGLYPKLGEYIVGTFVFKFSPTETEVNPNLGIERRERGEEVTGRERHLSGSGRKSPRWQQDLCKASHALWTKLF